MRAVHLKCPNCGGKLDAAVNAVSITCSYCGATAQIQHRSRFLERPVPLPPAPKVVIEQHGQRITVTKAGGQRVVVNLPTVTHNDYKRPRSMPVATAQHSGAWIGSTLLSLFVVAGVSFFVYQQAAKQQDAIQAATSMAVKSMGGDSPGGITSYEGTGNILTLDVNGDGTLDPINYARTTEKIVLALNSNDGSILWQSKEVVGNVLYLHGRTLIQTDESGNIGGLDATTGQSKWFVPMGEMLRTMCGKGPTYIALQLENSTWKILNLANGTMEPLGSKPTECTTIASNRENSQPHLEYARKQHRGIPNRVNGMTVQHTVYEKETDSVIALGNAFGGTPIPMLGYFTRSSSSTEAKTTKKRHKKKPSPKWEAQWAQQLPSENPLGTQGGAPEYVGANSDQICSVYEPKQGAPVAVCFNKETGTRMWEADLPPNTTFVIRGVTVTSDRVYISHWGRLDAFEAKTGALVFSVGR